MPARLRASMEIFLRWVEDGTIASLEVMKVLEIVVHCATHDEVCTSIGCVAWSTMRILSIPPTNGVFVDQSENSKGTTASQVLYSRGKKKKKGHMYCLLITSQTRPSQDKPSQQARNVGREQALSLSLSLSWAMLSSVKPWKEGTSLSVCRRRRRRSRTLSFLLRRRCGRRGGNLRHLTRETRDLSEMYTTSDRLVYCAWIR